MKHIFTLLLLTLSMHALATSTLDSNSLPLTPTLKQTNNLLSTPSITIYHHLNTFEYQTVKPYFWRSNDNKFTLNEITLTKIDWKPIDYLELNQTDDYLNLNGVTVNYQTDNITLTLGLLNNHSLKSPQEKIFIQGSLTIWTLNDFNLSLQGRIETVNTSDESNSTMNNIWLQQNVASIGKSISITGSYTLSDAWAVTGTMVSRDFTTRVKKPGSDKKSSDNMALIGTTYSF